MSRHISFRRFSLKSMIPDGPETRLWALDQQSLGTVILTAQDRATRETAKMVLDKKFHAAAIPAYQS